MQLFGTHVEIVARKCDSIDLGELHHTGFDLANAEWSNRRETLLTDISQNLSNQFLYCHKCLIHSNSNAKVQRILGTKEDFEKKLK